MKTSEIIIAAIIIIFIIVLMGSSIYPALRKSPRARCLASMKNLNTCFGLYTADYRGYAPLKDTWADALYPGYGDDLRIMVCPEARPSKAQFEAMREDGKPTIPVGIASTADIAGLDLTKLSDPVYTPVFFDSSLYARNATAGLSTMDFRHVGKTANVQFLDGHARHLTEIPQLPTPLLGKLVEHEEEIQDDHDNSGHSHSH